MKITVASLIETRQCDPYCGCGYSEKDGKFPCRDASRLLKKLQARDDFNQHWELDGDDIVCKDQASRSLAIKLRNEPCTPITT
jgi:hypothetical protein